MAIIRNDRRAREEQAEAQKSTEQNDEMAADYSWHPSLEEFDPHLSAQDWLALLNDPTVFDEDGLHAVECLHAFGAPTTLQQLSVRFRGTMGRYRRWLNTTAERVGHHLGIEAPEHDQYGNDEWWPLLYQRRSIGKTVANQHELRLRDELAEALDARAAEQKKAQHRAEQAQAKVREQQVRAQAEALRSPGGSRPARGAASAEAAPNAAEQRRAAQEARAEREARLSQITVDRNTESVPGYDAPQQEEEPQPRMTKAQAAVAARIAAAQARAEASGATKSESAQREGTPQRSGQVARMTGEVASEASIDEPAMAVARVAEGGSNDSAGAAAPHQNAARNDNAAPQASAHGSAVPASRDSAITSEYNPGEKNESLGSSGSAAVASMSPVEPVSALSDFPFEALRTYLAALEEEHPSDGACGPQNARKAPRREGDAARTDSSDAVHLPLDYAVRYSNRVWAAFDLIGEASRGLTAARVARLMGCESVEPLQSLLNGEEVPNFALVDGLCRTLGLNHEFLEAPDELEGNLPVFATMQELAREASLAEVVGSVQPREIRVLNGGSRHQTATMALVFGPYRCLLLDRYGVSLDDAEPDDSPRGAFVALVHALQGYALRHGIDFGNVSLASKEWRALQQGRTWPGAFL